MPTLLETYYGIKAYMELYNIPLTEENFTKELKSYYHTLCVQTKRCGVPHKP